MQHVVIFMTRIINFIMQLFLLTFHFCISFYLNVYSFLKKVDTFTWCSKSRA